MKNKIIISFALIVLSSGLNAQTGGPGQPEFMQFKPVTASDLVNLSSGSFSYNIPLFEIGGYPCNLSYQSGSQMDEVASMAGLGWNFNIGAITHTMRGLPDDFKGDLITRTIYMRPNITMGGNLDLGLEFVGFPMGFNSGAGIFYNNYNGYGLERSFGLSFSVSNSSKTAGASLGLGMKANSQSGVDLYASPSVSMSSSKSNSMSANGSLGGTISVNSREGLKGSVNASMSLSQNVNYKYVDKNGKEQETGKKDTRGPMSENFASYSAAYSFSKTAEIPRISYPFNTTSYTGSIKVGGEIYFLHPNATLRGYYTKQELSTHVINTPAYGFLYSDKSLAAGNNVLLDFNREKDQPYIKDVSKNIGIPFYTNDIYSVNTQGISGSFQLYRNDIGVIFDNRIVSASSALNIGLEVGVGNATHVGADLSVTSTSSSSGKWATPTTNQLDFRSLITNNLYEPAYFKNASDVSVDVNDFYAELKNDYPIKVDLIESGLTDVGMHSKLIDPNGSLVSTATNLYKPLRDPRTINIQYLTANEASKFGVDKEICQYAVNQFDCESPNYRQSIQRTDDYRQPHHISEMTATNIDGMRYVFGLPAYNITQEEVSFTLAVTESPDVDGLVNYNSAFTDWGTNGKDGFYEKTAIPAYVTSNLLTAVLSPDYIDIDNNGPSINDVGNYVKFNYINAGIYTWRTPYDGNKATFNKAFLSDPTDNKASFVMGTKELWYIHSIESKTEVAEFYYDTNRLDGLGAVDNKKLYKLTAIKIFSKNERVLSGTNAVPIRIIQLTQDYELCPGTKNSIASNKGKLTLKQVAMYSGKSMRELQSPYKFTYGEISFGNTFNPPYNPHNVNRWGNYQENINADILASDYSIENSATLLSNADFPYTSGQDENTMTRNAYAWNLTKIQLPGGGTIEAKYEPHHYAYTQDQRNMEMFLIAGFGSNSANMTSDTLYDPSGSASSNIFLKIKLKSSISSGTTAEQKRLLLYQYFNINSDVPAEGLPQYFYYKTLIQLRDGRETTWEWVNGYCIILNVGLADPGYAYVELKPVCINDKYESNCTDLINPIAKNAFQFMRMNRSGLCYGDTESEPLDENLSLEDFLNLNTQVSDQTTAFTQGFNKYARSGKFALKAALNKSFIRLYSPDQNKIIGGTRVKKIITSDNWNQMTAGYSGPFPNNKSYTIDYEYTDVIKNPVTNEDQVISSGVTEYEPFVGGDENPLHLPSFYNQEIKMAPDNNLYVDLPYNESLYPGANLIYSKVKVTSNKTNELVPGTGYQLHEFYTAKDYPIKTDHTTIGSNFEKKTSVLQGLVSSITGVGVFYDYVTISQGFSIVLNDMHGKTKSTKNFNSQGSLVSSEEFEYALNKNLQLISADNKIYSSNKLGVSVSAICDSRTTEHTTQVNGVDLNLDFTILAVIPSFLLIPLPKSTIETTRLNSVGFNKIINKKGILIKKTVTENGASISTENLLFDDKTGNTLLTKTTNEFNDHIYSFHYPAHWIYKGLSAGYVSSDISLIVSNNNTVSIADAEILNALNEGDELVDANGNRLWIIAKGSSSINVQTKQIGIAPIAGSYKVLRPGRRNLLNEEAGTVVTNYLPILGTNLNFTTSTNNVGIINASMKQYADNRLKYCSCDSVKGPAGHPLPAGNNFNNPYFNGTLGNWYPLRTWSYLTGRSRSTLMPDNLTNLRKDGIFTSYSSFFNPPTLGNNHWTINSANWQWVESVTIKDVNGLTLETKDALNRYNSMLTGYKQKLIVAESGNARQREIMYDGFEDWNYLSYSNSCDNTFLCQPDQINWNNVFQIANDQSHTGKFSGKLINPSYQVSVPLDFNNDCENTLTQSRNSQDFPASQRSTDKTDEATESICCIGTFRPTKGKKYIISAWVRETGNDLAYTFTDPSITIGGTIFKTSGNIIDGWQRIYGEFMVPANASSLDLSFSKGNNTTYLDDIRIYPADGKMTTYVYDRNTLKLTFTCDENNYFTKYNYDGENNLQSINKETEQGVQTIKEGRSSTHKIQ